ncbi:hypothetical protein [Vibrio crassostreae]|uniref:hypothetical protein n=1 Tax=Vibrio crassostreae TaxID=246167 RepID=UPI001B308DDC|nr:hypothetical protein [Vibrio crassostreae]
MLKSSTRHEEYLEYLRDYLERVSASCPLSCHESLTLKVAFNSKENKPFSSIEVDCVEGTDWLGQIVFHELAISDDRDKFLIEKLVGEVRDAKESRFNEVTITFKVMLQAPENEDEQPTKELAINRKYKQNY